MSSTRVSRDGSEDAGALLSCVGAGELRTWHVKSDLTTRKARPNYRPSFKAA